MNKLQAMIARLTGIDADIEARISDELEKRGSWEVVLQAFQENRSNVSNSVTPGTSLQVAAVWACVRVISETVASLPLFIYERQERGKQRASEHYLYPLLHDQANPMMTAMQFREVMQSHLCLWGNAYAELVYDTRGRIIEMWPLRPDHIAETKMESGRRLYKYQLDDGTAKWMDSNQVWQIPGLGGNGLDGYSPIGMMRRSIGLAMDAEEYGARFFQNDARPGIILEHPGRLGPDAHKNLSDSLAEKHQGVKRSHRPMILEEGMKLHEVGIPPQDAQFLETRKFQVSEIARMFRVPPHMIGDLDQATFSNIEHQALEFVVHSIRPWLVRWEQSIQMNLMLDRDRPRYYAEHLVDGLLRGDVASRYQAYAVARQNGWMSANDIRELENQNPVDGGDVYLVPLNMIPADQLGEKPDETIHDQPDQPDEPVTTARALPDFERRGRRSAAARHRLSQAQRGLIQDVAERAMRREVHDVGAAASRYLGKRDSGQLMIWLDEFYQEHKSWLARQFMPIMLAYGGLILGEVQDELDNRDASLKENVERFVESYTGSFAAQQAGISQYRLTAILQAASRSGVDQAEAVAAELESWQETRPAEMAAEQSTRAGNAITKTLYTAIGVRTIRWVTMGENCPYCQRMDGRTVEISKWFLAPGEKLEVDEGTPMTTSSNIGHAPLHSGCDCTIAAG